MLLLLMHGGGADRFTIRQGCGKGGANSGTIWAAVRSRRRVVSRCLSLYVCGVVFFPALRLVVTCRASFEKHGQVTPLICALWRDGSRWLLAAPSPHPQRPDKGARRYPFLRNGASGTEKKNHRRLIGAMVRPMIDGHDTGPVMTGGRGLKKEKGQHNKMGQASFSLGALAAFFVCLASRKSRPSQGSPFSQIYLLLFFFDPRAEKKRGKERRCLSTTLQSIPLPLFRVTKKRKRPCRHRAKGPKDPPLAPNGKKKRDKRPKLKKIKKPSLKVTFFLRFFSFFPVSHAVPDRRRHCRGPPLFRARLFCFPPLHCFSFSERGLVP